jgi:large repetitive protein
MPEAFVVSPGDQGGTLTNGAVTTGTNSLGDLDMWSFQANSGDNIVLRMGSTGFAAPRIDLYNPAGALVGTYANGSSHDSVLSVQATNTGTFTAVVSSFGLDGVGTYTLILAKMPGPFVLSPGDQGGSMTGSGSYSGHIALADQDLWVFTACKGDAINLQLYTTNFSGNLHLYGPNGALLATYDGFTVDTIAYTATNSGAFTILVSSTGLDGSGNYQLNANGLSDGLKLCLPIISGTNGNLGGVGGIVNAPFVLFTYTNVNASFALWTPILTNVFDSFGVFSHTNLFNPADPHRYFRLRTP